MQKTEWLSRLRKGLLEYAMLAVIRQREIYGYELVDILKQYKTLSAASEALYALLQKLEQTGLVASCWREPSPKARPRRYYNLTAEGGAMVNMMDAEWEKVKAAVDAVCQAGGAV